MDYMGLLALTRQLESIVGGLCLWASERQWENVSTAHAYQALAMQWESNFCVCTLGAGAHAMTARTCQPQTEGGRVLQPLSLSGLKYYDSSCLPVPARQQEGAASKLSTLLRC